MTMKKLPVVRKRGGADVLDRLRALNRKEYHAVLATSYQDRPHTSLVAYAATGDLQGLIFATPRRTKKYRNMLKNDQVSLLINTRTNTAKDYLKAESVTVAGTARVIRRGREREALGKIFTAKHPGLKTFISAPTTALISVEIARAVHVGAFQVVSEWRNRRRR